jgi:miniconductance mechanosensitive channel
VKNEITKWFIEKGLAENITGYLMNVLFILIILVISYLANIIAKRVILAGVAKLIKKSSSSWDDMFMKNKVFKRLSQVAPALVIYLLSPLAFDDSPLLVSFFKNGAFIYMVIIALLVMDAFLNTCQDIYQTFEVSKEIPIKGIVQAVKIILVFIGGILILSTITNKTPLYFLSGLGALTAVLMLIFKDAILGFVAGIQLSANNMVHKGDWVEMPQFGADGDVLDVSLTTVKVQNWDKTITTIPTYSMISHSFKNWRGMQESGGRRIKRALYIDMTSIRFCDQKMLEGFSKIQYISEYIEQKNVELSEYNQKHGVDTSSLVNGRKLTNIGTFRAYVEAYLRNHPKIHQNMTFLVRQLPPTDHGLPLEIYVFSNDQVWARYESIQADIFDHFLAAIPAFGLRVFQNPSGADFQSFTR